jgi:hypothetical protein
LFYDDTVQADIPDQLVRQANPNTLEFAPLPFALYRMERA